MKFILIDKWDRKLVSLVFFNSRQDAVQFAKWRGLGEALEASNVLIQQVPA